MPGRSVIYLAAVHARRCSCSQTGIHLAAVHRDRWPVGQLHTWRQSIETDGRWDSYILGGSPYRQMPGGTVIYLAAVQTAGRWDSYIPGGGLYTQMASGTVTYLAAVYTDRWPVGQLHTSRQSIQTNARSDSYIPGGSLYRQMAGGRVI